MLCSHAQDLITLHTIHLQQNTALTHPRSDTPHTVSSLQHSRLLHWTVNLDEDQAWRKTWSGKLVSFHFLSRFNNWTVLNVWIFLIWIRIWIILIILNWLKLEVCICGLFRRTTIGLFQMAEHSLDEKKPCPLPLTYWYVFCLCRGIGLEADTATVERMSSSERF